MSSATDQTVFLGQEQKVCHDDIATYNEDSASSSVSNSLLRRLTRSIVDNPQANVEGTAVSVQHRRDSLGNEDDGQDEDENDREDQDDGDNEDEGQGDADGDKDKEEDEDTEDTDEGTDDEDDTDEKGNEAGGEQESLGDSQHEVNPARNEANKAVKRRLRSPSRSPSPLPPNSPETIGFNQEPEPTQIPKRVRKGRRTKKEILANAPARRRRSSRLEQLTQDTPPKPTAKRSTKPTMKPDQKRKRGRPAKPKPETLKASGQEWEIEKIVGSRICADTHQHFYEVKWKGYSTKENTWEPKLNLSKCRDAIFDFEKRSKQK